MPKRPVYTAEFKEQAVRLSEESELTAGQVAKELGISPGTLTKWRREAGVGQSRKVVDKALREAQREVQELRRRVKTLEKEKRLTEMASVIGQNARS